MNSVVHQLADYSRLLAAVDEQVKAEPAWRDAVSATLGGDDGARAHLAVMHQPYLSFILAGRKTVESRFSRNQVAPYRQVRGGDLLLFKLLSGPVTAIAVVAEVDCYVLDAATWDVLRRRFTRGLAAEDEAFWSDRCDARYATLMRLATTRAIEPITVDKRDRRGWVVLGSRGPSLHPDQLALHAVSTDSTAYRGTWLAMGPSQAVAPPSHDQLRLELE